MSRTHQRPRRSISVAQARLLPWLGFRYSTSRDAFVLRAIGNHIGPVFQLSTARQLTTTGHAAEPEMGEVADLAREKIAH